MNHSYYFNSPRGFVVFNDQELTAEPVTPADLSMVKVASGGSSFYAPATWSVDCEWYFVVTLEGILLRNVSSEFALLCRKKSAMFIGELLKSGLLSRSLEKRALRKEMP